MEERNVSPSQMPAKLNSFISTTIYHNDKLRLQNSPKKPVMAVVLIEAGERQVEDDSRVASSFHVHRLIDFMHVEAYYQFLARKKLRISRTHRNYTADRNNSAQR